MVERDLQRERDNRDNIQADYNSLCQKVSFCSYCFVSCSFLLLEQSKHSKGSLIYSFLTLALIHIRFSLNHHIQILFTSPHITFSSKSQKKRHAR